MTALWPSPDPASMDGALAAVDPFRNLSPRGVQPQKSAKSLDQGVIAEVIEHNKRGRYPSDKTSVKISPT
jgi:hypothetical protein